MIGHSDHLVWLYCYSLVAGADTTPLVLQLLADVGEALHQTETEAERTRASATEAKAPTPSAPAQRTSSLLSFMATTGTSPSATSSSSSSAAPSSSPPATAGLTISLSPFSPPPTTTSSSAAASAPSKRAKALAKQLSHLSKSLSAFMLKERLCGFVHKHLLDTSHVQTRKNAQAFVFFLWRLAKEQPNV
jgi:hypothetical protein